MRPWPSASVASDVTGPARVPLGHEGALGAAEVQAGRARLLEAAPWRVIRGAGKARALPASRGKREIAQGGNKKIERRLRFRFRWLDQHRPMRDERKINRHRVEALVDHRLGEIKRR